MKDEKLAEAERKRAATKERKDREAEKKRLEEMAARVSLLFLRSLVHLRDVTEPWYVLCKTDEREEVAEVRSSSVLFSRETQCC